MKDTFMIVVGVITIIGVIYTISQFYRKEKKPSEMRQSGIGNTQIKETTVNINTDKNS